MNALYHTDCPKYKILFKQQKRLQGNKKINEIINMKYASVLCQSSIVISKIIWGYIVILNFWYCSAQMLTEQWTFNAVVTGKKFKQVLPF